jgi:hypothetical protein
MPKCIKCVYTFVYTLSRSPRCKKRNAPTLHPSGCRFTIVSGGQTGADRAALDRALAHGVECGGWCPKGRKAEDGPIDAKYPLKETPLGSYIQRTELNERDSDATVLFSIEPTLTGDSKKTMDFAQKHKKPRLHLCAADTAIAESLKAFVEEHGVKA